MRASEDWSCPVARAARVLGDPCTLLILRDVREGPRRFGELLGSAAGNTRLLSGRLRRLVRVGVLTRTCLPGHPQRVEYELTPMGRDLLPCVNVLRGFGERWLPDCRDPLEQGASVCAPSLRDPEV